MKNQMKLISVIALLIGILTIIIGIASAQSDNDDYEDPCGLPVNLGTCRAKVQRYYYNLRRKQCEIFYFGGCGGNSNNFKTLEECEGICSLDT